MTENLTNEEKRVIFYSDETQPTISSSVNPDTPLSSLNLNWREKDLPERERTKHVHRLHPYLGKFIPQLVEIFLRKYFNPGQTVLDPFGGSGTTLVQANELGVNSVAYDISALMEYKGLSLEDASELVVNDKLVKAGGSGGVICVDKAGNISMPFNSQGMFRAFSIAEGKEGVYIYKDEDKK